MLVPGGRRDAMLRPAAISPQGHTLASRALTSIATVTRRFHPRGTERVLRLLHPPDGRSWGVEAVTPLDGQSLKLYVDTTNFLEWQIFFYGTYETEVAAVLRRYIRAGKQAVDVGANVGIHTLVMGRAAAPGRVIACEPSAGLCGRLAANLALNGVSNVSVRPVAVDAHPGWLTLYPLRSAAAAQHLTFDPSAAASGAAEHVRAVTLDQLAETEKLSAIDLIKVDTDGLEGAILAGGHRVLEREHPALVFEYTAEQALSSAARGKLPSARICSSAP
jgi:FkbM family methyltransferase